ncbi:MBL fold metallo-hydrolase [Pseudomonas sp. PB101]|nr:MBL fold metallo-hydrolase [Pseudomonas sp. PB101]
MSRSISTLTGMGCRLDGGMLFGNTPRVLWADWMKPAHDNTVEISARVLLVQEQGKNILVMAGAENLLAPLARNCGCQPQTPGLLESLARRGLKEGDIDSVVLTHVHAHLSRDMSERVREGDMPRLLFPRARYVCGERHWHRARRPHPRDREMFVAPLVHGLESSGRLTLVDSTRCESLGDDWCFHINDGFTPGQLLPEIQLPGGPVVFCGDLIPGTHWLDLEVTSGRDRNAERVIDEKEHLLDHLVALGGRLFFARDLEVAMVKVMRDRRSRYIPFDQYRTLNRFEG